MMNTSRQLATFYLDGFFFGIEVEKVQEVIRYQEMTNVPLAPALIRGLINLRGQIVTALDLRQQLDMPSRTSTKAPLNIVIRHQRGVVSLLVDEIDDIVEVDPNDFEMPPETVMARTRTLIEGVYKLPSRLLLVLNTSLAIRVGPSGADLKEQS